MATYGNRSNSFVIFAKADSRGLFEIIGKL
jgi:hypothetical protein